MLLFWSGAAMLCILAIAFVNWPLYSRGQINALSRNKLNVEFFHNRLTELEESLKREEISSTEFQELEKELQLALVSDAGTDSNSRSFVSRLPFFAAAIIIFSSCLLYTSPSPRDRG